MADILPYLESLDRPVREELARLLSTMPEELRNRCTVRRLKKDCIFVDSFDRSDFVYVLTAGHVQATSQDSYGNLYVVADFFAPALFGEVELIAGYPFYHGTLTTKADCQFLVIREAEYLAWIQGNPSVLFDRARAVTRHLLEQSGNERNFIFWDGTKRLIYLLCQYYQGNPGNAAGSVVSICATRQEMADQIKVSVKTVSRGLQLLASRGLIHMEGRRIILNKEEYERLHDLLKGKSPTGSG